MAAGLREASRPGHRARARKAHDCMSGGPYPQAGLARPRASTDDRRRGSSPRCIHALCPLSERESVGRALLQRLRRRSRQRLPGLRRGDGRAPALLHRVRRRSGRPGREWRRRRAASRDRHVLRPLGLHRAQRGARPRGSRGGDGADQGRRDDDRRAARRHGQPVRRRRDHGALRRPARPSPRRAKRSDRGDRAAPRRRRLRRDLDRRAGPVAAHAHRNQLRPRRRPPQRRPRRRLRADRRRGQHRRAPAQPRCAGARSWSASRSGARSPTPSKARPLRRPRSRARSNRSPPCASSPRGARPPRARRR